MIGRGSFAIAAATARHSLTTLERLVVSHIRELEPDGGLAQAASSPSRRGLSEAIGRSLPSAFLPKHRIGNTYSHVLPALQAEAAAKLDAILTR